MDANLLQPTSSDQFTFLGREEREKSGKETRKLMLVVTFFLAMCGARNEDFGPRSFITLSATRARNIELSGDRDLSLHAT